MIYIHTYMDMYIPSVVSALTKPATATNPYSDNERSAFKPLAVLGSQ